ncbi:hypothetical protein FQZ97_1042370 [compost metagenome]
MSVVPWMASVTELLVLVTAMLLTVSLAFCAAAVCFRFCVPAGSLPSRFCSAASPSTEMRMAEASPVCVEVSTSRLGVPLPSFTMVADTPALAALIASRMPPSVLLVASMVIGLAVRVASLSKVAPVYWPVTGSSVPPETLPKSMVILPLPIAVVVLACPFAMTDCACASCEMSMA